MEVGAQPHASMAQKLLESYSEEVVLYERMLHLTDVQSQKLGERHSIEEFVAALRQKESLIARLDTIQKERESLSAQRNVGPEREASAAARDLNALRQRIAELIQQILHKEREHEQVIRRMRGQVEDKLQKLQRGSRIGSAVTGGAVSQPRFLDAAG